MDLNTSGLEENLCGLLGLQPHDAEHVVRSLTDEWRRTSGAITAWKIAEPPQARPFREVNTEDLARVECRNATVYLGGYVAPDGARCVGPVRIEGFNGRVLWEVP